MISLPLAAAAKVAESILAFLLYWKPMAELIGGPAGKLRSVYFEGLVLSAAATIPSVALMCWTHWSAHTSLPSVITAIVLGGMLWIAVLVQRRHPAALEVARLVRRPL